MNILKHKGLKVLVPQHVKSELAKQLSLPIDCELLTMELFLMCVESVDIEGNVGWNLEAISWSENSILDHFARKAVYAHSGALKLRNRSVSASNYIHEIETALAEVRTIPSIELFSVLHGTIIDKSIIDDNQFHIEPRLVPMILEISSSLNVNHLGNVLISQPKDAYQGALILVFLKSILPNITKVKLKIDTKRAAFLIPSL